MKEVAWDDGYSFGVRKKHPRITITLQNEELYKLGSVFLPVCGVAAMMDGKSSTLDL